MKLNISALAYKVLEVPKPLSCFCRHSPPALCIPARDLFLVKEEISSPSSEVAIPSACIGLLWHREFFHPHSDHAGKVRLALIAILLLPSLHSAISITHSNL